MSVLDRAYEIHATACQQFGPIRDRRLAHPFGIPEDMPAYVWRVSPDVYQALYDASPLPYPLPNPKSGDDGTTRLFGWLVIPDRTLPPNSMLFLPRVSKDAARRLDEAIGG